MKRNNISTIRGLFNKKKTKENVDPVVDSGWPPREENTYDERERQSVMCLLDLCINGKCPFCCQRSVLLLASYICIPESVFGSGVRVFKARSETKPKPRRTP